ERPAPGPGAGRARGALVQDAGDARRGAAGDDPVRALRRRDRPLGGERHRASPGRSLRRAGGAPRLCGDHVLQRRRPPAPPGPRHLAGAPVLPEDHRLQRRLVGDVFVPQKLTPVYGLRQKTYHFLQVMPKSNPTHIITTALVYTDANVTGPASPPFPYSSCKT